MCKNVYISLFVNRKIAEDLFHQVENEEQKFHLRPSNILFYVDRDSCYYDNVYDIAIIKR